MAHNLDSLSYHKASGQWRKKIKGKTHYFGTDEAEAKRRWKRERASLLDPSAPAPKQKSAELFRLANRFLDQFTTDAENGLRGAGYVKMCRGSVARMIDLFGRECIVDDLSPSDFGRLKARFFEPIKRSTAIRGGCKGRSVTRRSNSTVASDVRRIRRFLSWCYNNELIKQPRYGENFGPSTREAATRESIRKPTDLSREDFLSLLEVSTPSFTPILLLGMNAGIGNRDISEMRLSDVDLSADEVWVDLPRLKTKADRRFLLWPETAEAIRKYLAVRPKPRTSEYEDHLFITHTGVPWLRASKDGIGAKFYVLRDKAGVADRSFYDLRRTFQTVAADSLDFPAVQFVMGHAKKHNDMSARYTQKISDVRIRNVCDFVRKWLYPD